MHDAVSLLGSSNGDGIPRFVAKDNESVSEPGEEYCDGIMTPCTWLAPSAATANVAVNAESIPPREPDQCVLVSRLSPNSHECQEPGRDKALALAHTLAITALLLPV